MQPLRVTSRENQWFKRFRKARDEHDTEIVIEGAKHVGDALRAGWRAIAVATDRELPPDLKLGSALLIELSTQLVQQLSATRQGQGVIALFSRPATRLQDVQLRREGVVVVLDAVQDPGNVGTIIRLAAAFDADAVFLTDGCADPYGPKAARASAGAVLAVPIVRAAAADVLRFVETHGIELFAAAAGAPPLQGRLPALAAFVFGNEGQGVSDALRARATAVSIPMSRRVESLNVGAAAAILLSRSYEQRQ